MKTNCVILIFSKDRALQLDATIRSLLYNCPDAHGCQMKVLYKVSDEKNRRQYWKLAEEYASYNFIKFVEETDFKNNLLEIISPKDYVLFLVDDNIFVRGFSLAAALERLKMNTAALGFSLRLGRNTVYCYSQNKSQLLPEFTYIDENTLKFNWTKAQYDFGYPLEVSSSIYKVEDIFPSILNSECINPNRLEEALDQSKPAFRSSKPELLCFTFSAAYCNPVNKVQKVIEKNRAGSNKDYSPEKLSDIFESGVRINIASYKNFFPNACHQETELVFTNDTPHDELVSVVIPCFKQAHLLGDAVQSVAEQTYKSWECIIVNDGSPDNTSEVAKKLIEKYSDKNIRLVEKENGGLAAARNTGIKNAKGNYILPLDSDDMLHSNAIEYHLQNLKLAPDYSVSYSDYKCFGAKTEYINSIEEYEFLNPSRERNGLAYSSMYKREVWEKNNGYNTNMVWGYEDRDFWIGALEHGFKAKKIPLPLLNYRTNSTSMYSTALLKDKELKAQMILNHPSMYDAALVQTAAEYLKISQANEKIQNGVQKVNINNKSKVLSFFAGDADNFHFVKPIMDYLSKEGFTVNSYKAAQLSKEAFVSILEKTDLAWFEWGNGPVLAASRLPKKCPAICRVHRYELYANDIKLLDLSYLDALVLVNQAFEKVLLENADPAAKSKTRVHVIHNPISETTPFKKRKKNYNIAYVSRFHADKNPTLMIQILAQLVKSDPNYKIFMVGRIQDKQLYHYCMDLVEKLGLKNNFAYEGVVEDIPAWLQNKSMILSTSIVEAHPVGISEAMMMGLKPVIHNSFGDLDKIFGPKFIFNTADEAVKQILSEDFNSDEYRKLAASKFGESVVLPQIKELIVNILEGKKDRPLSASGANHGKPFISICIPTFNRAKYIKQAVDSALKQNYDNFEVIVADDGSTDETKTIISGINDNRLKYYPKEHSGAPATRNLAIEKARGEYILWLDSDDVLSPDILAQYISALNENPHTDILYGDIVITDENLKPHQHIKYADWQNRNDALLNKFVEENPIPNPGVLIKKSLYTKYGSYDLAYRRAHDYEWFSRVCHSAKFKHVESVAAYWRWHSSNMSSGTVKIDYSFEASLIKKMIDVYGIEKLFANSFSQNKNKNEFLSETYLKLSARFKVLNDENEAKKYLALYNSVKPSEGVRLYSGAKPNITKNQKGKILFVAHNFPPYWFAGVENYAYCMAKELQGRGYEVNAFFPKMFNDFRSTRLYESAYGGIRTFILQQAVLTSKLDLRSDEIERVFKNLLLQEGYDAVHFHHLQGFPLSLVETVKKLHIPVFYTLHDFDLICLKTHLYLEESNTICSGPESAEKCMSCALGHSQNQAYTEMTLARFNAKRSAASNILDIADAVVSPSKYLADKFALHGFGKNKIIVSPLGLPKLETKPDIKKEKLTFAFLGSIHPLKNYELLVRAFKKANIDAKLALHGNGLPINLERMKRLIAGDSRIEYKGEYLPKDLPDILASADVVVVPSITENYPTVIREALSSGKVVIASNVGGIPEIITNNENGFLFKSNDENELAVLLKKIAAEPKFIEQIKKNIKPVKSIEQDADEWTKRYSSFISKRKKKTAVHTSGVKKIRIGYISTEPDAFAVPYLRLRSPLNALQDKGFVEIVELGDFSNRRSYSLNKNKLQDIDIIIIQRQTAEHLTYDNLCKLIDRKKVKVVFDIDDALDRMPDNHALLEAFANIKTNIYEYLKNSDLVTVSTNTLRNYYNEFNRNIAVLPNTLNLDIWNKKPAGSKESGALKILLSGTATHRQDFALIDRVIENIISEYPRDVEFYYWGSVSENLLKYPQVKKFCDFADVYQNYAETLQLSNFDLALIPLEENQFNRAKSNIKWLEYSISCIPGIYTDIEAYNESVEDGVTGLLVSNTLEGWREAIEKMILDKKLRSEIKKNAYKKVSEKFNIEKNAALWHKAFESALNGVHMPAELIIPKKKEYENTSKDVKNVSIIVLTYNSSKTILPCLQSVEKNLRPGDEVIIADNASKDDTIKIVGNFIKGKAQFKLIDNGKNLGFSAGTNAGIKASKNPITILLNPDTMATNQWLDRLTAHFADDSIAAVGPISNYVAGLQRMDLYLRKIPKGYSIDQITDLNYEANKGRSVETKLLIGFCMAVRKDVLDKLGYLDEELFLGNDDLELSWRLRLNGYKLKVATDTFIYHEGQHSFNTETKTTTSSLVQQSTNALYAKLLKYYGEDNIPSPMELWMINWFNAENGKYNPQAKLEDVKPEYKSGSAKKEKLTSVIILTYNQLEYTKKCVDSIIKFTPEKHELIFVDNASTDGSMKYLEGLQTKYKNVKLIKNETNLGFPKAVNQGIKAAEGDYVLIANNDIHVTEGWLSSLTSKIELKNEYGIAGPISNKVSGFQIDKNAKYETDAQMIKYAQSLRKTNKDKFFEFPRVAFLCTLIKKEVIDKVGGLDERFTPGNYEDDDYCLRAQKAGYKTLIVQDSFVHHYGSKSFTADGMQKYAERLRVNRDIFVDKWGGDPDEIWIKGKSVKDRNYYYPLSSNNGEEAYKRAKILFEDGDYDWSKNELQKAFENCTNGHLEKCYELAALIDAETGGESSNNFNELFNEGYKLFSENDFNGAVEKFSKAKAFRNDSSLITNEELNIISGAAYIKMQVYDKAVDEFKSAAAQNNNSAKAYEGLGECYFFMDDLKSAKEMFSKTLALEEENKNALNKIKLINERLAGK